MAIKIQKKKGQSDESVPEVQGQEEGEVTEVTEQVEEVTAAPADPVPAAPTAQAPTIPTVSAPKVPEGYVKVAMVRTIQPPPIIGDFVVERELEVTQLTVRKSYHLPRNVALVLVDAQAAVIAE